MNRTDNTTMRLIHYPPCDFSEESCGQNETSSLRVGEHTDFGLFTILFTDGPGLQIKPVEGAEFREQQSKDKSPWLDVVPPKGVTAIVNTGALLARWTNDEWRATAHRVVVQDKEQASRSRYTIVAFFDPDKEAVISVDPKFVRPGEEPKYGPITGLDYLLMRLAEAQGPGKGKEQIIAAP